jgi:hypothetical protein
MFASSARFTRAELSFFPRAGLEASMRRSSFTVLCRDTPIGTVPLPWREFAAGRLKRFPEYQKWEAAVRAASEALLQFGLYAAVMPIPIHAARGWPRDALAAAASLPLTLQDSRGISVPTRFINLFETPNDLDVVVLARFTDAMAVVPAKLPPRQRSGGDAAGAA